MTTGRHDRRRVVAVDVGGTKVLAGLVDAEGRASELMTVSTPRTGGYALLETVRSAAAALSALATERGLDVVAGAVGTAGVVVGDVVVSANELLPHWAEVPLAAALSETLKVPVTVLNDVHASALAEARIGAARDRNSALVVAVGTGIGGALIQGGTVVPGRQGFAGSVGHIPAPSDEGRLCSCGARGHIEAYAGGRAIELAFAERRKPGLDMRAISALAAQGDAEAAQLISEAGELLGRVLGGAVTLVDPELVVIGGGVAEIASFVNAVRRGMTREEMRPRSTAPLVRVALGSRAVLTGAALAAFDRR
ncbi:MAG TPA: ROK family protein [Gryllotalpicola sp.]